MHCSLLCVTWEFLKTGGPLGTPGVEADDKRFLGVSTHDSMEYFRETPMCRVMRILCSCKPAPFLPTPCWCCLWLVYN